MPPPVPAAFSAISSPPNRSTAAPTAASTSALGLHVGALRQAGVASLRLQRRERIVIAAARHHARALGDVRERDRASDAVRGAGDQRDLPVE